MRHTRHRVNGYSLMELLITVVILAVVATLALPALNQYIQVARRADARVALLQISNEMEKYYSNNLAYTSDLSNLGFKDTNGAFLSPDGHYVLSATTGPGKYQVSARARTGTPQANDAYCAWFTLDSMGVEDAPNDDCW